MSLKYIKGFFLPIEESENAKRFTDVSVVADNAAAETLDYSVFMGYDFNVNFTKLGIEFYDKENYLAEHEKTAK